MYCCNCGAPQYDNLYHFCEGCQNGARADARAANNALNPQQPQRAYDPNVDFFPPPDPGSDDGWEDFLEFKYCYDTGALCTCSGSGT